MTHSQTYSFSATFCMNSLILIDLTAQVLGYNFSKLSERVTFVAAYPFKTLMIIYSSK